MSRARSPKSIEAEKLFQEGKTLIQIAGILEVPEGTVRRWKSTQNWASSKANKGKTNARKQKPNKKKRPGAPKGNQNAVGAGAPLGNVNALVHGGYSAIFWDSLSDQERSMIDDLEPNSEQILVDEIKLLTVREHRIMERIKSYNEQKQVLRTITRSEEKREFANDEEREEYELRMEEKVAKGDRLPGRPYHLTTITESGYDIVERLEEALTRCQAQKQRCIDSLEKIRSTGSKDKTSVVDDWVAAVLEADGTDAEDPIEEECADE